MKILALLVLTTPLAAWSDVVKDVSTHQVAPPSQTLERPRGIVPDVSTHQVAPPAQAKERPTGIVPDLSTHALAPYAQVLPRTAGLGNLTCSYIAMPFTNTLVVQLAGATGETFQLLAQTGHSGVLEASRAILLGTGSIDEAGNGFLEIPLPMGRLPVNFEVEFYALYGSFVTPPAYFILNPMPLERLDFNWSSNGFPLPAGMKVAEQWAEIGLHVRGENAIASHPDDVILFDSANWTGNDPDLSTPGYGWMNTEPLGNLLIIAENDFDGNGDGLIDDPNDESGGGTFFFEFDDPVTLAEITLIDIDRNETASLRTYDGASLNQDVFVEGKGDNSSIRIGFTADPVTRLVVTISGSGGIGGLSMTLCDTMVAFDHSTTGVPTGLQAGEKLSQQLRSSLGIGLAARSNVGGIDQPIVFDTANPSGEDTDLATPGYHPTNLESKGLVMILAEDLVDMGSDGFVDDPDDDANGGVLSLTFDYDVLFQSASVIDIDTYEQAWFDVFDAQGTLLAVVPLLSLGDNSVQSVAPGIHGVRTIELVMTGSGALADLAFCRDEPIL